MPFITLSNASLAFGHVPLLDHTGLSLESGERLGLIGRNGSGKSSLLKILAGLEAPDDGLLQLQQGLRRFYVPQEPAFDEAASVFEVVSEGVAEAKAVRAEYEVHAPGADLDALQTRIEALDAWNWEQRVDTTLHQLHLDGERLVGELSGGMKKRVALAQALVAVPDVLLLDEPTNHLDLDSIAWLEQLLRDFRGAVMLITHDRAFLDNVATRIVELDRGTIRSYPGNFATYERVKEEQLAAEALANARADKLLAQEEVWIRKGVEARRTRSVARIQRLEVLRAQREKRRESLGQVRLEVDSGVSSGKIVAELKDVTMRFGDKLIVSDFSATILRGDKVGLIGPNGAGKTTLLKLILGELEADSGKIRQGAAARFRDKTVDISDCGPKVRKLIEDAIIAEGIQILVKQVSLFSADFEEKLKALRSDEASASRTCNSPGVPKKFADGTKRTCRSGVKIRALVGVRPLVGIVIQSAALPGSGEAVVEICQTPCAATEALPTMAT